MREFRLGDVIDDFCVRCKRIMNHSLVSLVNGEPAKVRSKTTRKSRRCSMKFSRR